MQKTNVVLNQEPVLMSAPSPKTLDAVKPTYHLTSSIQPPKGSYV